MKILIADDDPVSRLLLEKLLAGWGYDVVAAADGEEAWWVLQQPDAPRLAILDWMMPGMDGLQICRELRKNTTAPYTYLLLLTAKSGVQSVVEGLQAGADDYVTKPFEAEELKVRLRAGRRILDLQEYLLSTSEAMRFPATHDFLTGLCNREAILGLVRQKLARRGVDPAPAGVILADLDHLREVGEVYGTEIADAVVRETARRIRSVARIQDAVGRTRAGEFLVLVPGCYGGEILKQAEKLRAAISAEPIDTLGGTIAVTVTVGVATTEEARDAESLLRAADVAMRRAKARGRNSVEAATVADTALDRDLVRR